MMRKFFALVLVAVVLLSISAIAFAEASFRFDIRINSTSTSDPLTYVQNQGYKTAAPGYLYVRHYLTNIQGSYTNYFRATVGVGGASAGYKWCTPGLNVPIQSSSLTLYRSYSLAARGNTDYYTFMGQPSILVNGNCFYNQAP